jgi:hypothetical protein
MIKLGTDYALTTDSKVYRFVTKRIIATPLQFHHADVSFRDLDGRVWASVEDGVLYIAKGYAWNGCSPKRKVLGIWVGTPDEKRNVHASLVHDVLFQFSGTWHFKLSFDQVNCIFRSLMRKDGYPLSNLYYLAVMKFGINFWKKNEECYSTKL